MGKSHDAQHPFYDKYITSYLVATIMFILSLTFCDIFANVIKCNKYYS